MRDEKERKKAGDCRKKKKDTVHNRKKIKKTPDERLEKQVFLVCSTTSFPAYTLPFLSPDQLKHATPPLLHSVECVVPDLSRLRLRPASPRRETDAAHRHTHIKVTVLSLEFTFTPSHARIRSQYTQICACKGTHMQRYK